MRNLLLSAFALVCLLPMNAQTVNTRIYPAEKLAKVKAKADTPTYAPAIKTLMKEADKAMNLTPPSVMDKSMTASSGDKHDYMSMGPYWWPDPSKPDGLPYIRKDGLRNPELSKLDRDRWETWQKPLPHWELLTISRATSNMRRKQPTF